jgi:hypothetical protein
MSATLDTGIPHAARIYNYVLGGKDNFQADRDAGDAMMAASPLLAPSMRANRKFMTRVARHLAEQGFTQYLDIGTGLPLSPNLHETVQQIIPAADVVYVDNDPLVLTHARALLQEVPGATGRLGYIEADLREPDTIFADDAVTGVLDLSKPVAVTIIAMLQLVGDDDARRVVADIVSRLAAGSALVISTVVPDQDPAGVEQIISAAARTGLTLHARTPAQVLALMDGLRIADPGLVPVHEWRPDEAAAPDVRIGMYGALGLKP